MQIANISLILYNVRCISTHAEHMNKEFINRLDEAFEYGSMADVARRLGIPHATVRNYYKEGRLPAPEVLIKIANQTNVSLNWLLTGKGDMYGGMMPPVGIGRFLEEQIAEIVDRRLAEHGLLASRSKSDFDVAGVIDRLVDPQSVMKEWFRFEGREYPSDFGVVFFKGWEGFSLEERVDAIRDAKRVLDRSLTTG